MLIQGQAGNLPTQSNKSGQNSLAQGWLNESLVSELLAPYASLAQNGLVFTAAMQAVTALSLLSTATATGLILVNPASSGKNLHLLELSVQTSATEVATGSNIVLAFNGNPVAAAVVNTTPATISNALLGSGASSVARANTAATLPAVPIALRPVAFANTTFGVAATAGLAQVPTIKEEFRGGIIIAPG